jgi:hypothetical protein
VRLDLTKHNRNTKSVREGSRYFFPYTHEVFRRLLAEIYNPKRLADSAGPAPANTSAMANLVGRFAFCTKGNSQDFEANVYHGDLVGRFAFRTKGNSQDFEANVYHGAVVVCFRAQGQTVTVDLEKRITAEGRQQHHEFIENVLKGETLLEKLNSAQQSLCFFKDAKRYALLHPAVPMQLRVFLEPRITEDGCKRYFQLEMDPEEEDILPVASVIAGEPYLHLNTETGSAEGCFFAFIADFNDPQGTLRAETLNTFGHVDAVAACHQIDAPAPLKQARHAQGLSASWAQSLPWRTPPQISGSAGGSSSRTGAWCASSTTPMARIAQKSWSTTRCFQGSTQRLDIARRSARSSGFTLNSQPSSGTNRSRSTLREQGSSPR